MPDSDIRALGRLSQPVAGGPPGRRPGRSFTRLGGDGAALGGPPVRPVARRRPVVSRGVVLALLGVILGVVWLGSVAVRQTDPRVALADVPAAPAVALPPAQSVGPRLGASADRAERSGTRTRVFAAVDGLFLDLVHADPVAIAFHEATQPEALPLDPIGTLEVNDNPTKFTPPEDVSGATYRVLSSRGRARPATSAVDVVVPDGAFAHAPVTGRVVEVREYVLYEKVRDWRVVIEPADRPDLQVVLIHLHQPRVAVGDLVTAGESPLAVVRLLPMTSHVDYVTERHLPHVHLEVKPAVPVDPADPNAPALDADADADLDVAG